MKTHPLNVSYLVIGLVFLGISGSWLLRQTGVIDLDGVRWLLPATLVAAGAIGLVAFFAKSFTGRERPAALDETADYADPYGPVDYPVDYPVDQTDDTDVLPGLDHPTTPGTNSATNEGELR